MRWKFLELQQICVETVQKGVSQERVWHFTRWFFCSILFEYTIWSQPLLGETRIPIPQLHHIVRAPLRCYSRGMTLLWWFVWWISEVQCCKGPSTMLSRGWCKVSLEQLVDEPYIPIDRSCQTGGKDAMWSSDRKGCFLTEEGGVCAPRKSLIGLQEIGWLRK